MSKDKDELIDRAAAELVALREEVVMLTARAEIAEEDAADAWATVVDVHRTWGALDAGGDPDFVDRRNAFLAKAEAARVRFETQGGMV